MIGGVFDNTLNFKQIKRRKEKRIEIWMSNGI